MSVPLYLDGTSACRVEWDEPALKCLWPDKAEQFFPLSRVSRVIVMGACEWETAALLACADQGISVIFLNETGDIRARLIGQAGEQQSLLQRLTDLLAQPDGYTHYQTWLTATEKRAVRSAARRLKIADWQTLTVNAFRQAIAHDPHFQQPLWRSLLHSEVLALLISIGLDARWERLQSPQLDLAADITQLISWDFSVPCYQLTQQQHNVNTPKAWLAFYQERNERVDSLLKSILHHLHIRLIELT